ncbi:hypothetical protein Kpol_1020p53 [Vanderwaltozyma polyspora DSM 70294]|uniref:Mitochondrial carnitine carrier n=1 Tax=Vanderwaltozyma polyspora (strain ATCC 22028 / DSM 70294 / BCRC 21397 / CBS 2163 / NBRC 10782 / NRRL Y-8283 / UCD 57-17) TaxID=436907 RepID=A7TLG2_VANPO|nr:uncharacterized protein Kpol_1020p53 [Vanderwaltozyma polyspora DSM 70294]EDO16943.1 hypothetical protein Kpol_1020p53 [Vanderwaltozyma polyspora DSM 70294]
MSDSQLGEELLLDEEMATDSHGANKGSPLVQNLKSFAAGGVGGVCAVLTGHPFDLIKVRCQNNQASSTSDAIKKILAEVNQRNASKLGNPVGNYFKGFYKGVIPPLVGVTPIFAVSFWGYDIGKKIVSINNVDSTTPLTTTQLATAGFLSAIPTTLVTAPTERIKVVLQTSTSGSFVSAANNIVRTGGLPSLFKGSLATLARDGPGSALYFASYEYAKGILNGLNPPVKKGDVNILNVCLSGGIAGMSMWLVVFPIDTIKTKLQASTTKVNMVDITKEIYRTRGGIKGFFPGLGPALLRSFPANAATFLGVELTHSIFKKYNI